MGTNINKKLPTAKSEKLLRKKLFREFDANGNGILSLAEVEKGIRDVLNLNEVFGAKPAIIRAFQIAKDCQKANKNDTIGDDYIEFNEFRFFLLSLRQYFDHKISLEEFKEAQSQIEIWVGKIDPDIEFKYIDINGGGSILFDEFCDWAIKRSLDLEDDDDNISDNDFEELALSHET